jgi:hypothetical protein
VVVVCCCTSCDSDFPDSVLAMLDSLACAANDSPAVVCLVLVLMV